eukprot:3743909-Pyramimonas_sp.AAC.1
MPPPFLTSLKLVFVVCLARRSSACTGLASALTARSERLRRYGSAHRGKPATAGGDAPRPAGHR